MRILAFSDLHANIRAAAALVRASARADLVIGAGDFCNMRQGLSEALDSLSRIRKPIIAVPGNAESAEELRDAALPNMTVLHGEAMDHEGFEIFGIGGAIPQTPFGDWSFDLSETEALGYLTDCSRPDILITHSPPKGICDVSSTGQNLGSVSVRATVERCQPRYVLCGHIHDSWRKRGVLGGSKVINLGPKATWITL